MKWLVAALTILVFGLAVWLWLKPNSLAPAPLGSKIINLGKVEISATPMTVKPSEAIVFKLAFTTHSVDLSYDFTKLIRAEDDRGNTYLASNWAGGPGGHHLEGNLTLVPLRDRVKQLKLVFTGIDQKGGELKWEL